MKIKVTEIECTADELRSSRSVSDAVLDMLRNCFYGNDTYDDCNECDDEEGE